MELTANDILQVAIGMERLGRTFYESLSLGCGDEEIAALASSLAKCETEHIAAFERMRKALPPQQRGGELTEKELFAATVRLRNKIMPGAHQVLTVVQTADPAQALDMAIEMENEAVAFYAGLASGITGLDHAVLTAIADEEKAHLDMLKETRTLLTQRNPLHGMQHSVAEQ